MLRGGAAMALLGAAHLGGPGCLRVERGIEIELALSWLDAEPGEVLALGGGTRVQLDDGIVWIESASLLPCLDTQARVAPVPRPTESLWSPFAWGPPRAQAQHAHHGGGGTSLAGPLALEVHARGVVLGVLRPPPDRWCGVHVALAAAQGPTLALAGTAGDGASFSAWAEEDGFAHLVLEAPLDAGRPGRTRLEAFLFGARPFGGLVDLPDDPHALGEHLIGGHGGGTLRVADPEPR
jgi:hypothetical protein